VPSADQVLVSGSDDLAATGALSQALCKNESMPFAATRPAPLEGDPTREVRITSIVWTPGAGNPHEIKEVSDH
jgi:hypothetical protein